MIVSFVVTVLGMNITFWNEYLVRALGSFTSQILIVYVVSIFVINWTRHYLSTNYLIMIICMDMCLHANVNIHIIHNVHENMKILSFKHELSYTKNSVAYMVSNKLIFSVFCLS